MPLLVFFDVFTINYQQVNLILVYFTAENNIIIRHMIGKIVSDMGLYKKVSGTIKEFLRN